MSDENAVALQVLRDCGVCLLSARVDALRAGRCLADQRRLGADELAVAISDILAFCHRLQMCIEGDIRARVGDLPEMGAGLLSKEVTKK